uniref:Putative secreted protein n=1 Tax=Amblyomma triste TaxID=251400 RepID=A0A023G474_AMBTT
MNAVLLFLLFLLTYGALGTPMHRPIKGRQPEGYCHQRCFPSLGNDHCPAGCGCYREPNSRYFGMCFKLNGPHPNGMKTRFLEPRSPTTTRRPRQPPQPALPPYLRESLQG